MLGAKVHALHVLEAISIGRREPLVLDVTVDERNIAEGYVESCGKAASWRLLAEPIVSRRNRPLDCQDCRGTRVGPHRRRIPGPF